MANTPELIELQTWLPRFFTDYQACRPPPIAHIDEPVPKSFQIDVAKLTQWLADLQQPMIDARKGAFHFDPWEVAGLRRDEVRNSAVLAWLLNPKGSHGMGDVAMRGLLGDLNNFDSSFPAACSRFCRVRIESNPDGDSGNRVDIEVDDANFFVLIEVKIGAPEGVDQLKRYGDIAKQLAGTRPWALVFLTPQGMKSNTAGVHVNRVLPMSWRQLSHSVAQSVKGSTSGALNTSGPARHMAEQAVQRFLKQMRTF